MPTDHTPQHSRRPHYNRGRRGPDRRGGDRRPQPQQQPEAVGRDNLDIEQIMREIRARISERHGIDLSTQQIQELAARRLEAILDPRSLKPSLMDELRRAAGLPFDAPARPEADSAVEATSLYQSSSGLLRFIRRALNPLLKLFFDPNTLVQALDTQARLNKAAAIREAEQQRRQTEWNSLHYEVLRRVVTDLARADIDTQQLALRVESLSAKVDFNERRVRAFEQTQHQTKPVSRTAEVPPPPPTVGPAREDVSAPERSSPESSAEGSRRRRRRRRGRRSGSGQTHDVSGAPDVEPAGDSGDRHELAEGDDPVEGDTAADGSGEPSDGTAHVAEQAEAVAEKFEVAETAPGEPAVAAEAPPAAPTDGPAPAAPIERHDPGPPEQ